ncbi:TIGR01777 family oxidoreductase [Streptomyces sp. NPDC002519]
MKIVIPGGTGQVGTILNRALTAAGHEVVVLSRRPAHQGEVRWDGKTLGPWAEALDGSDVVVNLAGRSVSCRYTADNLQAMMGSRVDSARVVGEAIAAAARPPRVWLQMSTATIYAHRFDAPNDEETGVLGGTEAAVPGYWAFSVDIAKAWEREQEKAGTPATRKVALRSAMVMSPDRGGVFDVLLRLARLGLGGPVAGGAQYVSWIHDHDFVRAVEFLVDRDDIAGPVNLAAPEPVPQRMLMRALRAAWGVPVGLPATKWMAELGAFVLRSDTELLLKSRRVVPGRLLTAGFTFDHPLWPEAAIDLVHRLRGRESDQRHHHGHHGHHGHA